MMGGMGDGWGVERRRRRGEKGNGHSQINSQTPKMNRKKKEKLWKKVEKSVFYNQNSSFHE